MKALLSLILVVGVMICSCSQQKKSSDRESISAQFKKHFGYVLPAHYSDLKYQEASLFTHVVDIEFSCPVSDVDRLLDAMRETVGLEREQSKRKDTQEGGPEKYVGKRSERNRVVGYHMTVDRKDDVARVKLSIVEEVME